MAGLVFSGKIANFVAIKATCSARHVNLVDDLRGGFFRVIS